MDKRHPLLRTADLAKGHIEIDSMELLLIQDVRTQRGHIRFLLYILPDQSIHIPGFVMLRQRIQIFLYLFFDELHAVSSG